MRLTAALALLGAVLGVMSPAGAIAPSPGDFDLITNVDASRLVQVPGGSVSYTATAENRGPNEAPDVVWEVWVEAAESISNPVCSAAGGAVCPAVRGPFLDRSGHPGFIVSVPSLPADSSLRLTFDAVSGGNAGVYQVRSSVASDSAIGRDLEPVTNTATDNVAIANTDGVSPESAMTIQSNVSTSDARWGQTLTFEASVANLAFANAVGSRVRLPMPLELSAANPGGMTRPQCVSVSFPPFANPSTDVCGDVAVSSDGAGGWIADVNNLERFGGFALRYSAVAPSAGSSFRALATVEPPAGFAVPVSPSVNVRTLDEVQVGSFVWIDDDGDGVQDPGEGGLAGADVILLAHDDQGNLLLAADLYGNPVMCVVTTDDGEYLFEDLPPGNYKIQVESPAGYEASPIQNAVIDDRNEFDSNIHRSSAPGIYESAVVELRAGAEPAESGSAIGDGRDDALDASGNMTVDFGFVPLPVSAPASDPDDAPIVSATPADEGAPVADAAAVASPASVVESGSSLPADACCDSKQAPAPVSGRVLVSDSETPLANVEIVLKSPTRGAVDRVFTDQNGDYEFPGVPLGDYNVVQVQPDLYGSLSDNVVAIEHGSVATTNVNFVEVAGVIVGRVTLDGTGQSFGDVTITLTGTDLSGQTVQRTTSTELDGTYRFDDLAAGTYQIVESQPAGYDNGSIEPDNTITVALKAGTMSLGHNFTEALPTADSVETTALPAVEAGLEATSPSTSSTTQPDAPAVPEVLPFDEEEGRGWLTWAIVSLLGFAAAVANRGLATRES